MTARGWGILLAGIAIVASSPGLAVSNPAPRDLPANVAIHDLVEDPDRYDGRRVVVSGFISSITLEVGRRGSEYALIMLEETVTGVPPTAYAVKVISLTIPRVGQCEHALVQGIYHREGKHAGRPYELFIDAEAVVDDRGAGSGLVPSGCEQKL